MGSTRLTSEIESAADLARIIESLLEDVATATSLGCPDDALDDAFEARRQVRILSEEIDKLIDDLDNF